MLQDILHTDVLPADYSTANTRQFHIDRQLPSHPMGATVRAPAELRHQEDGAARKLCGGRTLPDAWGKDGSRDKYFEILPKSDTGARNARDFQILTYRIVTPEAAGN
jgi:hypothetical protein